MNIERFDQHDQHSLSLPPFDAWKEPGKWLNLNTGLPKKGIELLPAPIDDRGFVKIDEFIDDILSEFFVDDIEWAYDPDNYETRTDNHHFYYDAFDYGRTMNGDDIPKNFRELPTNIGRMPRQLHNVIHLLTERPDMPDRDNMYDYTMSYQLAHAAFKNLYLAANKTVSLMGSFTQRRLNVASGQIVPRDVNVGEEILKSMFNRHFSRYGDAVEKFKETEGKEIVYKDHEAIKVARPIVVARKMGAIVNRKAVLIRLNSFDAAA